MIESWTTRTRRAPRCRLVLGLVVPAGLAGCGEVATLPDTAGTGPQPTLPPPKPTLIPTVDIAPAVGWPEGVAPEAAAGLAVNAFATGLEHPRWLYVLPNGDVLVAETNAPPRPKEGKGVRGWFMGRAMQRAGARVPSANRITLLRDADGDGVAELRTTFLKDLNSPFGMALVGEDFYVANTDAVCASRIGRTARRSMDPASGWQSCRRATATTTGRRT
jgi:glucose/arabinose dehydrogenase